jgi:triosephosphate isomerase
MARILAGNWKMNLGLAEAGALMEAVRTERASFPGVRLVLFPPLTALSALASSRNADDPELGAQNCHVEPKGAFTGEVAAEQIRDAGAGYVLVGHSERRRLFGENDALVNGKLKAAWRAGLTPFLCVGETLAERERHETRDVLSRQLSRALDGAPPRSLLVVAYEPVWAIGTGVVASPAEVEEAHLWTREELRNAGRDEADSVPVLYGGSVDPKTAGPLSGLSQVDGFLVGGASLSASTFLPIARALEEGRAGSRGAR